MSIENRAERSSHSSDQIKEKETNKKRDGSSGWLEDDVVKWNCDRDLAAGVFMSSSYLPPPPNKGLYVEFIGMIWIEVGDRISMSLKCVQSPKLIPNNHNSPASRRSLLRRGASMSV